MRFHHVHVEYERSGNAEIRYQVARKTWLETYRIGNWNELRAYDKSFFRNSKLLLGDTRSLPFVHDLINFAADTVNDPNDVIVITNDDTCFAGSLYSQLENAISKNLPAFAHRWDFHSKIIEPVSSIGDANWYCGTDLFAFTKAWWMEHRSRFPDFVLGCEYWDCILRLLIRRSGGVELHKAIYHEWHDPIWFHPKFRKENAGQRYNTHLANEWFANDAIPSKDDSLHEYERYAKAYWSGISDSCPRAITPGPQWEDAEQDVLLLTTGLDQQWMSKHSVIEFGCGEGRLASPLSSRFERYYGFDLSPSCIERALLVSKENTSFRIINSVTDLTDKQDCIVSWTVFMHMPPRMFRLTIEWLAELLNPGGYLCFQLSFTQRHDYCRYDLVQDSNLWTSRWYPDEIARNIITDSGLHILREQGNGRGAWLTTKP